MGNTGMNYLESFAIHQGTEPLMGLHQLRGLLLGSFIEFSRK